MAIHYREEQQVSLKSFLVLVPLDDRTRTSILNGVIRSHRGGSAVPNQSPWPGSRLHDRAVFEAFLDLLGRKHVEGPRSHETFPVRTGLSDLEIESSGLD